MKKIVVIIILFVVADLSAQSTGYLGKRVMMGYGFNASPAIFEGNANNETIIGRNGSAESGSLAFNVIHEGFVEIAPTSRWEIGLSVRYFKTICDNSREFRNGLSYQTNGLQFEDSHPNGFYNITGLSYTLYFRYFGTRYIAPWGRYLMFGPVLNTYKTIYDPAIMNARAYDPYSSGYYGNGGDKIVTDFGPTENDFKGFNIMVGFGRSRIIGKRVVLDYGINAYLISLFSTVFDITNSEAFSFNAVDNTNYIKLTSHARVRGLNRVNAFIKIGVLLF
jgi:hypothetical protein